MKRSFLISLALTVAATAALAQPASRPPREPAELETVSVNGTGEVTLTPDRYTFNVGVQTQAASVEDGVNQKNAKSAAVLAALHGAGATDQEIRTSGFSIYPQQDYQQGQMPRVVGYQVSNNITVTRKQAGDAGKLLQVAVGAGVNTASGIQFEVSDPTRGRDKALAAAFVDAHSKAALLAAAAGRTLGRAISITEAGAVEATPPEPGNPALGRQAKGGAEPLQNRSADG